MIAAAGLDWIVEQYPLQAVVDRGDEALRVRGRATRRQRPQRHAAPFWASWATATSRSRTAPRSRSATRSPTPGEAHWIGAGSTRGGARVHALMRLDREIRIGGAEGEDVLPLLCFRNGHDGGLAVTVSVAPFRLACLNGMLLPLQHAQRTWKARHTANIEGRLADARRTLGVAWRYYDELEEIGAQLIGRRMGDGEFERFLARLVPLPDPTPDRPRRARRPQRRARARGDPNRLPHRRDLADIRGTAWGALQAVDRLRRPHAAHPPHRHPHAHRGALRAGHRAAAAQGRRAAAPDRRERHAMTATLTMVPLAQDQPERGQPAHRVRRRADGRAGRLRQAARDHHTADARTRRRRRLHDHRRRAPLPRRQGREAHARCPPRCATPTAMRSRSPSPRT